MNTTKIFHIEFHTPPPGTNDNHFYFGSISAIYEVFSKAEIGCQKERLWDHDFDNNGTYSNRLVTIRKSVLYRKTTNRKRP